MEFANNESAGMPYPAPILRLPLELLMEVFKLCDTTTYIVYASRTLTYPQQMQDTFWSVKSAGCILSLVCSDWSRIVLNTPSLWASISLQLWADLRLHPQHGLQRTLAAVEGALRMSKAIPLTVDIIYKRNLNAIDKAMEDDYIAPMRRLLGQSHRWLHLHLRAQEFDRIVRITSFKFPILQSLRVTSTPDRSLRIFKRAPRLHNVTVPFASGATNPIGTIVIPWSQLTMLRVGALDLRTVMAQPLLLLPQPRSYLLGTVFEPGWLPTILTSPLEQLEIKVHRGSESLHFAFLPLGSVHPALRPSRHKEGLAWHFLHFPCLTILSLSLPNIVMDSASYLPHFLSRTVKLEFLTLTISRVKSIKSLCGTLSSATALTSLTLRIDVLHNDSVVGNVVLREMGKIFRSLSSLTIHIVHSQGSSYVTFDDLLAIGQPDPLDIEAESIPINPSSLKSMHFKMADKTAQERHKETARGVSGRGCSVILTDEHGLVNLESVGVQFDGSKSSLFVI